MASKLYEQLSHEGKVLVDQAMEHLDPCYDPERGLVGMQYRTRRYYGARPSMYYALGLMLLDAPDCVGKTEKIIHAVIDTQIDAPTEIFHGVYRHDGAPVPAMGVLDYRRLGLYGRYYADCFYERMADAFRLNLKHTPELADHAEKIEEILRRSLFESTPVVWSTYEPNSREFILMCLAMLLEHFSDRLSPATVHRMEQSARMALAGAVERSITNFSPLNTNIQCMHVFALDYFGTRLKIPQYREYALKYANEMLKRYRSYHAAAEFNSPTYCSVDLATLGFWRRYGSRDELRQLGAELEAGIWRDMMEFYNPALRNFCGPYSRAYELDQKIHTGFNAMLYWVLGEDRYPWHDWSHESASNPLMVLGSVCIPPDAQEAVFTPKEDVDVFHQFRELSERGDPDHNDALCTATGWISPRLMIGALAGSENPSHQLHPLVIFWRCGEDIGTVKLLRCWPNGGMHHMHTVYFNGVSRKKHIDMDIHTDVNRDVKYFYEIECPGAASSIITPDTWQLPGLTLRLSADAPMPFVETVSDRVIRVCYLAEVEKPETMTMHFSMDAELPD
ncbi:MAG: hypothetical protein II504_12015 [Clostridia bacterium]|nr:hypothetical protein [Clostridia bacterium]